MIVGYLILLLLIGFGLLLISPKGFLLHELGQLPYYLWKVRQVSLQGLTIEKFKFGAHRRQYFLLFQSEQSKTQEKPVIVYYHGGGWTFGSPEKFKANAKFFTDLGYTVFMPSYRRLPFYRSKAIVSDCFLALQKIEEVMRDKHWNNRKIILGGMSAGGNVASLLLLDKEKQNSINFDPSRLAGIMLHGAPLDLNQMFPTPLLYCYGGFSHSPTFAKASPITHLQKKVNCPMLIIHGTKDGMVSFQSTLYFVEKCKALNLRNISFYPIENGTHLDVGRWIYTDNDSARWIKEWLKNLENGVFIK